MLEHSTQATETLYIMYDKISQNKAISYFLHLTQKYKVFLFYTYLCVLDSLVAKTIFK